MAKRLLLDPCKNGNSTRNAVKRVWKVISIDYLEKFTPIVKSEKRSKRSFLILKYIVEIRVMRWISFWTRCLSNPNRMRRCLISPNSWQDRKEHSFSLPP